MNRKKLKLLAVAVIFIALAVTLWPRVLRGYAVMQVEAAKRDGLYATPEEGMRERITEKYKDIERIVIDHAGPNSSDRQPHVWFVSARVYAAARGDGQAIQAGDYDYPGSYFLHVDDGWVHMSEGAFPELVGSAMAQFELFGCDEEKGNCG